VARRDPRLIREQDDRGLARGIERPESAASEVD
jgi:hypothetical protein